MKKILAFASAATVSICLAACGEAAEDTGKETAQEIDDMAAYGDEGAVMSDAEADAIVDEADAMEDAAEGASDVMTEEMDGALN